MTDLPQLSICIVSLNAKAYLRDCLDSIYKNCAHITFEIIVVDNGSTDNTIDMLTQDYPEVRTIINKTNTGFTRPNNQAMQIARATDYILLLNPDTLIPENSLENLVDFANAHPQAGIVGPKVLNRDGSFQTHCKRGEGRPWDTFSYFLGLAKRYPKSKKFSGYLLTYLDENQVNEVPSISGCCMLIRKKLIEAIGGLDEDLFAYQEDTEYCVRARKAGWQVFYAPVAEITHFGGRGGSRTQPLRAIFEWHRSYFIYYNKHLAADYFFLLNWFYYLVMAFKLCASLAINLFRQEKHAGPRRG
jgi:GT2 family glycosyltransferase